MAQDSRGKATLDVAPPAAAELSALLDALPRKIWLSGPDGGVVYDGGAFKAFTGAALDARERPRAGLVHADDLAAAVAARDAARRRQRGPPQRLRWRLALAPPQLLRARQRRPPRSLPGHGRGHPRSQAGFFVRRGACRPIAFGGGIDPARRL